MGLTVNCTSRGKKSGRQPVQLSNWSTEKKRNSRDLRPVGQYQSNVRYFWGPEERKGKEWGKRNIWSSNAWNFLKIVGKHQLTGPRSSVNSKQNKCNKDHIWVHSIAKHTHMHKTKPNQKNLKSSQRGEMTLHLNKQ